MNSFRCADVNLSASMCSTQLYACAGVDMVHITVAAMQPGVALIAYVVGGQRDELEEALAAWPQCALVRTHALPLDEHGDVDEAALQSLPVWTGAALRSAVANANASLGAHPAQGAFAYRRAPAVAKRLHLSDLSRHFPLREIPAERVDPGAIPALVHAARLSVFHAPPVSEAIVLPSDLASALARAAGQPELGCVHVGTEMEETRVSYAQLYAQARRVLSGLRAHGLRAGDVLIVDAADSCSLLPLFWACVLGGMVPAPFIVRAAGAGGAQGERLRAAWEVLDRPPIAAARASIEALRAQDSHATEGMTLLDAGALMAAGEEAQPVSCADPHALAMVFLTSGSTGVPKGVMLSQANVLAMVGGVCQSAALAPGATSLNWMPLDHAGGLVFLSVLPVILLMQQVQVETATVLAAPARWLDLVHRHRICVVWTPNFAFDLLMQASAAPGASWDLSCLDMLINGGEAVSDAVLTGFAARFAPHGLRRGAIWPSFGMTETVSGFSLGQWEAGKGAVVSLGWPIGGAAQRIVDESGEPVQEGVVGELELGGAALFIGYFGRPDLTAAAMHGDWFRSGDLAYLHDGALFVVGRSKEVIIVNGANFYNAEIEELVAQVAGVDRLGVAAVGVRAPGASTDQLAVFFDHTGGHAGLDPAGMTRLMQAIREKLGKHLSIRTDYLIALPAARLPRTASGKVQRIALRRAIDSGAFDAEIKHAACLLAAPTTIPAWFAQACWRRCQAILDPAPASRRVLVLGDASGDDAGMLQSLAATAPQLAWIAVDGGAPALAALLARPGVAPHAILLLPGAGHVGNLLAVCQAVAGAAVQARPQRLLVCGFADGAAAAAAAFLRTSASELGAVFCQHLQCADACIDPALVVAELQSRAQHADILVAQGVRHVGGLRALVPQGGDAALRMAGVYALIGGLGGVGLALARHLQSHYQARLLLIGRTPRHALDAERAQALQRLEQGGAVRYAVADAADGPALQAAADAASAVWERELDGVLYLAGAARQSSLAQEDAGTLERFLQAAMDGSRAAHALVAARAHAWFIVIGSVSGLVAGRNDAAYAAAHAWQAAMIGQLHAGGQTRCRFLGFSAWRDTGMSRGIRDGALLQAGGYFLLDPAHAVASFEAAIASDAPVLAIGLDLCHPRHLRAQAAAAPVDEPVWCEQGGQAAVLAASDALGRASRLPVVAVDAMPRSRDGSIDRRQLARLADGMARAGAPRSELEHCMAGLWCELLGVAECGVDDDFFALGGNSLRAAGLTLRTRERFRIQVVMADLLAHPTVAAFCACLTAAESRPGLTEAIARRWREIATMSPQQKALRIGAGVA